MMRMMLYEAAQRHAGAFRQKWSWLKAWAIKIARPHRGDEEGDRWRWRRRLGRDSCTACGLTGPSSGGRGKSQWLESVAGSNAIGGNRAPPQRWNDVPRGTMDEGEFVWSAWTRRHTDGEAAPKRLFHLVFESP